MCIDIANAFQKSGYETRLYTGEIQPTYSRLNSSVEVVFFMRHRRSKTLQRLFTWTVFFLRVFVKLLFADSNRRLLIVSNPPFNFLIGYCMKKFKRQGFELLIYDVYPDVLVKRAFLSDTSIPIRIWQKLNRKIFSHASRVITIGNGLR